MGGIAGAGAPGAGCAIVQDGARWLRFEAPERIVEAFSPGDVRPAILALESATLGGLWAAGFLAYEAAAAFGLAVREAQPGLPLVWFGLYRGASEVGPPAPPERARTAGAAWTPALDRVAHGEAMAKVKTRIGQGDTYQVNLTFPLHAAGPVDPWDLFRSLRQLQGARHAAYVDTGRFAIVSASPEMFFRWEGDLLETRPMKGTAPRGATPSEDDRRAEALAASAKDRAENLMIVDMLRNDLGKVAVAGSVRVRDMFAVERYPTVLQMTSTVEARTCAGIADILEALFPCASVTGAPKKRTMEIIAETERTPRGVYTGAAGWVGPARAGRFNVAIRTAVIDRKTGASSYGVGSGVVADSTAGAEYAECLLKARVLAESPFRLLETLRFTPAEGFFLVEAHLDRLLASAAHFGATLSRAAVVGALDAFRERLDKPSRVRLLVDLDGGVDLEACPLETEAAPARVALAREPVDEASPWLHHKTTRREVYDAALAAWPGADEVILWNRRDEVTEACRYSLVIDLGDGPVTPPVSCGLLPGTFRAHLLATGQVRERVVTKDELRGLARFKLVNSVRGIREAVWMDETAA